MHGRGGDEGAHPGSISLGGGYSWGTDRLTSSLPAGVAIGCDAAYAITRWPSSEAQEEAACQMTDRFDAEGDESRRAYVIIADEAAGDDAAGQHRTQARIGGHRMVLGGVVGLAAAVVAVLAFTVDWGSSGPGDAAGSSEGPEGTAGGLGDGITYVDYVACSRVIAEGEILRVRDAAQHDRVTVTLQVKEWIKPADGVSTVDLTVVDPAVARVRPPFEERSHVLMVVPLQPDREADAFRGEELVYFRSVIDEALARAANAQCPLD